MRVEARQQEGVAARLRPLLRRGPPLAAFPACVAAAAEHAAAGTAPHVVVLAVDGLGVEEARALWAPSELLTLVTTVPSASAPAWLTAMTGAGIGEHLVAGMVVAHPAGDGLLQAVARHDAAGASGLVRRTAPTIFERARSRGFAAVAHPGALDAWPGPWRDALLAGARVTGQQRAGGGAVAEAGRAVAEVDATLEAAGRPPLLVWAYVDLDTTVHARGYDADVRAAVTLLGEAAERWAGGGAEVLAVSDHGLTPVEHDPEAAAAWQALERGPLCRLPAGGAGRTRWLYAAGGRRDELRERAEEALGDLALVCTPEELADAGAFELTGALRPRLGDVVAIATDPRFPVPDPAAAWEHGAITPAEMLAPCASWGRTSPARATAGPA